MYPSKIFRGYFATAVFVPDRGESWLQRSRLLPLLGESEHVALQRDSVEAAFEVGNIVCFGIWSVSPLLAQGDLAFC